MRYVGGALCGNFHMEVFVVARVSLGPCEGGVDGQLTLHALSDLVPDHHSQVSLYQRMKAMFSFRANKKQPKPLIQYVPQGTRPLLGFTCIKSGRGV